MSFCVLTKSISASVESSMASSSTAESDAVAVAGTVADTGPGFAVGNSESSMPMLDGGLPAVGGGMTVRVGGGG